MRWIKILKALSILLLVPVTSYASTINPVSPQTIPKAKTSDILPQNLLSAKNYTIDPVVTNNGKNDIFVLSSDYEPFVAEGQQELARRISEINAMVALDNVQKSEEFAKALLNAGKAPFEAAWSLITEPVDTVTGIFEGIGTTFSRIGGMITQERGELEDAKMKEVLGVSAVKRKYAAVLEVDVYSSNKLLQEKLNAVSWAVFAGGLTTKVVFSLPESNKVVDALRIGGAVKTLNSLIENSTPEDLRFLNEQKLQAMKVPAGLIERFLKHSWYSPRHQTTIVAVLEKLPHVKNRQEFISRSLKARNEREAFNFQHGAEMLLDYDQSTSRIKEFIGFGRTVLAYDSKKQMVVVIPFGHLHYTNETANSINRLDAALNEGVPNLKKVAVFIDIASPIVVKVMQEKGWTVLELRKFSN